MPVSIRILLLRAKRNKYYITAFINLNTVYLQWVSRIVHPHIVQILGLRRCAHHDKIFGD